MIFTAQISLFNAPFYLQCSQHCCTARCRRSDVDSCLQYINLVIIFPIFFFLFFFVVELFSSVPRSRTTDMAGLGTAHMCPAEQR